MEDVSEKRVSEAFVPLTPQPAQDDEIDLAQLFGVLWRGKWLIILFSFLAALIGGYYAYKVAVPKYTATAQLALLVRDRQVVDLESVISGVSTEAAAINTELEVIRSRTLMEQLVLNLNLIEDPEFNWYLRPPSMVSRRALQETLANYLPINAPAELPKPTPQQVQNAVVGSVRNSISAASQRNTYLINISATTGSAAKSATIANALANLYLNDQVTTKFAATEFAVNWISERVAELELELREKEDAIANLRAETELISLEALETLNARVKEIRERLADTEARESATREQLERYESWAAQRDFSSIKIELTDPTLSRLEADARGGDALARDAFFARVQELVERETVNTERLEAQRKALQDSYDRFFNQTEEQNSDFRRLNTLTREAESIRVLYETFVTRLKETSIQMGLVQADSRVLSSATSGRLIEPRKRRIIAISIILGGMIGLGIILLRQLLQNGVRTSEELEKLTGYAVIGQIPLMPIRRRNALIKYLHSSPTSAGVEAIRNLRTSILMSDLDNPPKIIMSTSSIPGEGKTTQAIALAHNFAGLGKRVLLIEGDIRRRTLAEYFTQASNGSLVKVISGDQTLEEAVIHDPLLNIDILMGEKSPINAADLFTSDRFAECIRVMREAYDLIIIDTPPVLVVPDARIVGQCVDAIVYSVAWDKTARTQIVDGLQQFSSVGLRVNGVVLSQVDPKRMKRYGYGNRYGAYSTYGSEYYDA